MTNKFKYFQKGIELRGETADPSDNIEGSVFHNSTTNRIKAYIESAIREVITNSQAQTLTNKTLTSPVINTPTGLAKADVGLGNVDNTSDATKDAATATLTNKTLTAPVINSPTGIVKADVGLSNVDNTSDATKNSATVSLTNKTFGDAITLTDITTPSTPGAGLRKLYSKADGSLYQLDSAGSEVPVGSSSGELNFYPKGDLEAATTADFTTGNNASFDGGGTLGGTFSVSTTSTDLIRGNKSAKLVGSATAGNNINDYIASTDIAIPQGYRGQLMLVKFRYRFDGTTGNVKLVVKDATNSTILNSNLDTLTQYVDATNKTSADFETIVTIPASCANIKVGFQVITGEVSKTLVFDDVIVSPNVSNQKIITPFTDWAAYTPTFNGLGTVSDVSFFWRRNGSDMEIKGSATAGTVTASALYFSLPNSLNINTTVVTDAKTELGYSQRIGGGVFSSDGGNHFMLFYASANGAGNVSFHRLAAATSLVSVLANVAIGNNEAFTVSATIPIQGWTSADTNILIPTNTFSTDTNPLTYAGSGSYTPSTLKDAPVGTFITHTYNGSNTRVQTTSAPTQTTADMATNGILITARQTNATTSTAALPCVVQMQIGKGLKSTFPSIVSVFKNTGKDISMSSDFWMPAIVTQYGFRNSGYDSTSGILTIDKGLCESGSVVNNLFDAADTSTPASSYVVLNASRIQPNVAIPVAQTVYLKDVKSAATDGGTFTSGSWVTRTLNTVEGASSIVALSANQFTLQSGEYVIEASAPAFSVNNHKAKLYNITTAADTIIGSSSDGSTSVDCSNIYTNVNLTSATTFEIRHQCQTTKSTNGLGTGGPQGVAEVYTQVKITKIK